MDKYISIDKIVHTISKTHKFDKEKLYAINTSDVLEGEIINAPLMEVSELKGQFKKTIEKGDLLFSEIRPANKRYAKVKIEDTRDYVVSTKLMVLRKYNDEVDFDYFYYCLTNEWFLNILQKRAENRICSFPQITFDLLSEYKFRIPQLSEQKRIAETLSLLDQKIALNTRINAELEAMAKQLYDYWFVQFDFPDENGNPYKSSGGQMVYNSTLKREIPAGWEIKPLRDLLILEDSRRIPLSNKERENRKGIYPYYGATGIMDYVDNYIFDGDFLLLAEDGSTSDENGNPVVQYIWGKNWVNNHAHIIHVGSEKILQYYYFLLKTIPVVLIETGSIQKKISQDNLLAYSTVCPPESKIEEYCNIASSFREKQKNVIDEIKYFTHLRDSLLPMLMNGQVTVE